MLEHLAERRSAAGIKRSCLLAGGFWGRSHEDSIEMLRPYSEIFLPVAIVDPEITGEQTVSDLYEMGYRGLKMIGVKRSYDEPDYFPMYRRAQDLELPISSTWA